MIDFFEDFLPIWALGFVTGFLAGITVGIWAYSVTL